MALSLTSSIGENSQTQGSPSATCRRRTILDCASSASTDNTSRSVSKAGPPAIASNTSSLSSYAEFVGGKGGVGKSTVAATSATGVAKAGYQTLVVTTDPAAHLEDVFGDPVGHEPTSVGQANFDAARIDQGKSGRSRTRSLTRRPIESSSRPAGRSTRSRRRRRYSGSSSRSNESCSEANSPSQPEVGAVENH